MGRSLQSGELARRIKDSLDIVEVVGQYVDLSQRGANHLGLCPFHAEKTPSFSVNRAWSRATQPVRSCSASPRVHPRGRGGARMAGTSPNHREAPQRRKSHCEHQKFSVLQVAKRRPENRKSTPGYTARHLPGHGPGQKWRSKRTGTTTKAVPVCLSKPG